MWERMPTSPVWRTLRVRWRWTPRSQKTRVKSRRWRSRPPRCRPTSLSEEPPPEEPPPPPEECDGEDNDGDGEIDEGFEDTDGDGIPDCREVDYTIRLSITVDDVYSAWVDGEPIAFERAGWNVLEEHSFVLNSGRHVVAVHGWDTGLAIQATYRPQWIDEVLYAVTGDGSWRVRADWAICRVDRGRL